MNLRLRLALQSATGWFLVLAFVFTCGVSVPARGNFQKPACVLLRTTVTEVSYLVDELNHTGHAQVLEEKVNGSLTKVYTFGHDLISLDQYTAGNWNLSYYGYDGHGSAKGKGVVAYF